MLQGNASGGKRAQNSGLKGDALVGAAWSFIEQKSVLPQHPPSGSYVFSQALINIFNNIIFDA